jgi:hypothetical protein
MTDEANTAPATDAVQPSQIIHDTGTDPTAQGKGVAAPEQEQAKEPAKLSTRDAIAKAFDEAEAKSKAEVDEKGKAAAEDAKVKVSEAEKAEKVEAKPDKARDETGKFAKAQNADDQAAQADKSAAEKPATGQEGQERRQSEGQHREPPARFLPEARTKWANVPNEVKAEFHRVSQEYEAEITKGKQASERYEPIRQFDEIAKSNGRELKDSLAKVIEVERALAQNPIAGLDAVLREIGPRKADGSHLSLMDVLQYVAQNPQAYQRAAMQPGPQQVQQQDNPQVSALAKELHELKAQMATQSVTPTIERFAAAHPDYHTLEPQIAAVLNSGVIDQIYGTGLSPEQKLTEAYRMAGGNPPSRSEPEPVQQHSEAAPARPVDPDGQKSIKGAPTSGQTGQPAWKPKSNREALERAFASVR